MRSRSLSAGGQDRLYPERELEAQVAWGDQLEDIRVLFGPMSQSKHLLRKSM